MQKTIISPLPLGYVAVFLPAITFHLCYLISLMEGHINFCIPYWADCVSVSRTGRHGSSYFIFKGGIITTAALLLLMWQLTRFWLRGLGSSQNWSILCLSLVGSTSLIVYTLALGHTGDTFYLLRRFGVVLFMFCSFISQLIAGNALSKIEAFAADGKKLLRFSAIMLAIAMFSLVLDGVLGADYDRIENAFEWWLIMLLLAHLFMMIQLWKKSKFMLVVTNAGS